VGAWKKTAATAEELLEYRNPAGITGINVYGVDQPGEIQALADFFHIHPLTVEDILDAGQRPKTEEFDEYLFITLKAVNPGGEDGQDGEELCFEHMSIVVAGDTVLTFQEKPGDYFEGIRKRILNNAGRIRRMGADFLAYTIIDAVVDEYFAVLDSLGAGMEEFEERAIDENDESFTRDIQKIKQDLLHVRRVVWPLRESISLLMRIDSSRINDALEPFFKDLLDHTVQAAETVETYRELIAGVMEINLSSISNRMNKVMKVLTIISTIFIPLTFVVGVYGMNFTHMPELEMRYAYPVTWAVMILIAAGMLIFFKRRRWM
jgi:magnesium transporter